MLKLIPFLLLAVPMAEIAVFVLIGTKIGVAWTLALIVVTAIIGSILLRIQGFSLLTRIQREIEANRLPGAELGHGAMLLVAGILLLTPGFVTDTIGFLLFVPAVRSAIWRWFRSRLDVEVIRHGPKTARDPFAAEFRRGGPDRGTVVDLDESEYARRETDGTEPDPSSPWRRPLPDRDPGDDR